MRILQGCSFEYNFLAVGFAGTLKWHIVCLIEHKLWSFGNKKPLHELEPFGASIKKESEYILELDKCIKKLNWHNV